MVSVGVVTRIGHAASDPFELKIRGKGTRGVRLHRGITPISAGCLFLTGLDAIVQRFVSPADSIMVSVGRFHAGDAANVIPEDAVVKGAVRP